MSLITKHISRSFLLIVFAALSAVSVFAQAVPDDAPINSQKAGSVLIFNYYGSNSANRAAEDTRISITNTNLQAAGRVAVFFIDGATGNMSDGYICLAANQTISFLASDIDPNVKGYIIAVSVDATGRPNKFNYFTGSELIKMAAGYYADLNAETISALVESPTIFDGLGNGVAAWLKFDGVRYNKLPGELSVDYVPPIGNGNKTMIIVNQIGGSLFNGGKPDDLAELTGEVYDAATNVYPWQEGYIDACQLRKVITNDFPKTTPNMSTVLKPGGWYGWMKFKPTLPNRGVTGVVLYLNPQSRTQPSNPLRFTGGRNLHHLTLVTDELTIPITAPIC
jgi:hypothetical protein